MSLGHMLTPHYLKYLYKFAIVSKQFQIWQDSMKVMINKNVMLQEPNSYFNLNKKRKAGLILRKLNV